MQLILQFERKREKITEETETEIELLKRTRNLEMVPISLLSPSRASDDGNQVITSFVQKRNGKLAIPKS
jgi:hypothetical protein